MANELKKVADDAKKLWGKLSPRRRVVLVGAAAITLVLGSFLALRSPMQRWSILYSGLASDDAGQVVAELKNQKIPFQIEAGGTAVSVPEDRVHELRLGLAQAGIPRGGGVGFEVFDKQSFGATSFVEQVNHLRAQQGELQRTIQSLDAVERARVHIAMRERSLYRREDEPPTASVVLKLRGGRQLAKRQVAGIVHLVAASVEGLTPERVTVVDEKSNVLSAGDDGRENQGELETTLSRRVEDILARFLGAGHVAVTVTADIDTSQTEKTEESYDPAKTALRSEARTVEGQGGIEAVTGGVAGARGNLPGAPAPTTTQSNANLTRLQETRNFEVNRVVSRVIGPKAHLRRLHVAVLVDGKPGTTESRGKEELARIEALAREAAGLDADRGDRIEVHSVPFWVEPAAGAEPDAAADPSWPFPFSKQIALYAGAGAGALILLVVTLLLLRRRKRRPAEVVTALPLSVSDLEAALPEGPAQLGLPAGRGPRDRAVEAARIDSARAARVLGGWLTEAALLDKGGTTK